MASIIPDGFRNLKDYCFYTEKKPGYALILYTANVPPGKREGIVFTQTVILPVTDLISTADPPLKYLLLNAEAIPDIDTNGVDTPKDIHQVLPEKGITLGIARANKRLRETMQLTGLEDLIGVSHFYPSIRTAIEAFRELSLKEA
ncbi:MAG: STAS domain-containing protein [Methanoregulaceae archaeon]|nr:STAS domain-containing protein [Methanoregulaceae archaeon]